MTATIETDPPEVAAFWRAIGDNPADQLPRLVFADWLEEREEMVVCSKCLGVKWTTTRWRIAEMDTDEYGTSSSPCEDCNRTGYVGNGYADLAAALRATADRVPLERASVRYGWTEIPTYGPYFLVPWNVKPYMYAELSMAARKGRTADYPTPEAAIRDLCAAWVKVNRKGVPA